MPTSSIFRKLSSRMKVKNTQTNPRQNEEITQNNDLRLEEFFHSKRFENLLIVSRDHPKVLGEKNVG